MVRLEMLRLTPDMKETMILFLLFLLVSTSMAVIRLSDPERVGPVGRFGASDYLDGWVTEASGRFPLKADRS